jgi:hypothetical protein
MIPIVLLLLVLAFAVAGLTFYLRHAKREKANKAERQQPSE